MKSVTIVGFGYVGRAMARFFDGKYSVRIYDPFVQIDALQEEFPTYAFIPSSQKELVGDTDLVVICVPTPMAEDGSCDTSAVDATFDLLKPHEVDILIKSTVPPNYTKGKILKGYNAVFSPEYLGESAYTTHYWKGYPDPTNLKTHEFQIFGGGQTVCNRIIQFFKSIMGPETRYLQTDSTTAELAKYMENCFFATKVTFCNEFYDIAQTFGVDYNELRELWLNDGRINRNHTLVFEDKRGYGGKCYPKDMSAMVVASLEEGYTPKLLQQVVESNKEFNKKSQ